MASLRKQERFNALLRNLISSFIRTEIGTKAIVTVMRVETTEDLQRAKIFISIFPEEKEKEVLNFLKNNRSDFNDYIKNKIKMRFLPVFSFEIDKQAKMERHIDELLKK